MRDERAAQLVGLGEQLVESVLDVMTNTIDHFGMLLSWHGWRQTWLHVTILPGAVVPGLPGLPGSWSLRTMCTGGVGHRPCGPDRARTARSVTTARRADAVTPARGFGRPRATSR